MTAKARKSVRAPRVGKPRTVAGVLMRAADLVDRGWTRDWYARTADERRTSFDDPKATQWCAHGAIMRAAPDSREDMSPLHDGAVEALLTSLGIDSITKWNDDASQAEVSAALRRAARIAQEKTK